MTATDTPLGDFEGRDVASVSVIVNKTGDGLSDPMDIAPRIIHQGERGKIVLEYECKKIRFDPIKDTDDVKRVQILEAIRATFFDHADADAALKRQDELIEEARRRREDGVDDRQLTIDDTAPRGGEPQTIGEAAVDVLDTIEALEDSGKARNERTRELDNRDDYTVDDLRSLAAEYDIAGRSKLTRAELVDALVDHEAEHGLLEGGDA